MPVNVLTQRNAPDRRGINREETVLKPEGVRFDKFGKLGVYPVDASVFAQPLYVSQADCGAKGVRDLVIIATMHNSVFAFDATEVGDTASVWSVKVGAGIAVSSERFDNRNYDDFYGQSIGILSTPVIELSASNPASGIIYLVAFELDAARLSHNGNVPTADMIQHVLIAVNLGDGHVLQQTVIRGQYPGSGYHSPSSTLPKEKLSHQLKVDPAGTVSMDVIFDAKNVTVTDVTGFGTPNAAVHFNSIMQLQRPALLLQGDNIYIAFGSRGDEDPYHGWLFTYDKRSFQQTGIFCTTPNGVRGGIWQAGQGLIQDDRLNVYACTGNGDNDKLGTGQVLVGRNLGESFVGFRSDSTGLRLNGWFSLFRDIGQQPGPETGGDELDDDFGAGAPALLPDNRVVAGGKDGWFFLIDPDQLDKTSALAALPQAFKASFNTSRGSRTGPERRRTTRHIHGSPVVWSTGTGEVFVYVWGETDVVRVFHPASRPGVHSFYRTSPGCGIRARRDLCFE
jgi:hypothetical protein